MNETFGPEMRGTQLAGGEKPLEATEPPFVLNPACSVCGRQDETVRLVVYPYVLSFVVITLRRAFTGLWCRKHRNIRMILACVITSTIGWFGIPWGFVYTPMVLFRLARGGDQPEDLNGKILVNMAGIKARQGDYNSAVRCLEASLQYKDDDPTRGLLRDYRMRAGLTVEPSNLFSKLLIVVSGLLLAAAIGALVGVLDYLFTTGLGSFVGEEVSLYIAILSWVPFIVLSYLGGIGLTQVVEWVLARISIKNFALGLGLGIFLAVFAVYGIPEGAALSDLGGYLLLGGQFETTFDLIFTSVLIIFIGGYGWIAGSVKAASLADSIYLVIMGIILVYYLGLAIWKTRQTVRWQQRIGAIY